MSFGSNDTIYWHKIYQKSKKKYSKIRPSNITNFSAFAIRKFLKTLVFLMSWVAKFNKTKKLGATKHPENIRQPLRISSPDIILMTSNSLILKRQVTVTQPPNQSAVMRFCQYCSGILNMECPNAYYNFLKNRKSAYHAKKQVLFEKIQQIYHENDGIFGHRVIQIKLAERNIRISKTTLHKYMNKELALHSIVRKKKPDYRK